MGDVHCQNKKVNQEKPGNPRTGVPTEENVKGSLRMKLKESPGPSQS